MLLDALKTKKKKKRAALFNQPAVGINRAGVSI